MNATNWLLPFSAIQLLRESPWFCTPTRNILERGILWFVVQPSQIDISQHNQTKCMNIGDTGVKPLKIFPDSTLRQNEELSSPQTHIGFYIQLIIVPHVNYVE